MNVFQKIKDKIETKKNGSEELLFLWQDRFRACEDYFRTVTDQMAVYQKLYDGDRNIVANPNKNQNVDKKASNVQNVVYELIEAQINSVIPKPKVDALNEEDRHIAVIIEEMLNAQINRLSMEVMNDQDERVCPINGGSWYLIEWDNTITTHNTVGNVAITALHPKQVIPQAGVSDWRQGEYIFVMLTQTKEYIKRRYNVDVINEDEKYPEIERKKGEDAKGLVTQVICYFKNEDGGIGIISWVNDVLLEYLDDYQARKTEVCAQCGKPKVLEKCVCGSQKFSKNNLETEKINMGADEMGMPLNIEVPYYKPNMFPLVLRKNVSEFGKVLGASDVEKIADQQNQIKKLSTVIDEKMYSGGSYVLLPKKINIETTERQVKVVRVTPEEASLFRVINVQPDMNWEIREKQAAYQSAKDTLGITDSFQGKPDNTAQSGVAKEISARQSNGRLESKRVMKDAAYQEIYEIIFKLMLAYADEPRPYKAEENGKTIYKTFNRNDFLKQDEAGQWYFCDEFLFSTDAAGAAGSDRQYLWEQNRLNLQSGTYGNPQEPDTLLFFWQAMERSHYPNAKQMCSRFEQKIAQMEEQQRMQQAQMIPQQGMGAMPMDMIPTEVSPLPPGVEAQL